MFSGGARLWLNISATLFFLSFHAGSHLTIGVASWTWSTLAVALDLKRKLATKSCIASFFDPNLDPKTGRYKISPPLKFTAPASTLKPCSTCVSCLGGFFPRRVPSSSSSSSSSSSRSSSNNGSNNSSNNSSSSSSSSRSASRS